MLHITLVDYEKLYRASLTEINTLKEKAKTLEENLSSLTNQYNRKSSSFSDEKKALEKRLGDLVMTLNRLHEKVGGDTLEDGIDILLAANDVKTDTILRQNERVARLEERIASLCDENTKEPNEYVTILRRQVESYEEAFDKLVSAFDTVQKFLKDKLSNGTKHSKN